MRRSKKDAASRSSRHLVSIFWLLMVSAMTTTVAEDRTSASDIEARVADLLEKMTLEEKVGQMNQVHAGDMEPISELGERTPEGRHDQPLVAQVHLELVELGLTVVEMLKERMMKGREPFLLFLQARFEHVHGKCLRQCGAFNQRFLDIVDRAREPPPKWT